jgi:hypothetical protein
LKVRHKRVLVIFLWRFSSQWSFIIELLESDSFIWYSKTERTTKGIKCQI